MIYLRLGICLTIIYFLSQMYQSIKLRLAVENISSVISEMNERMID